VVKVVQFLTEGMHPAPGILGKYVDLVWLHYGLNIAVFALTVIAGLGLATRRRAAAPAPAPHRGAPLPGS
jgi:hypothetical protein